MTLTVCVGSSGSGKTTFLNDVHKLHNCTYIRQYHNLRPYIAVSAIPNFDPTRLPYWGIYIKEKKDKYVIIGGTIAGTDMAGLSGGQRKILLFELISQRTATQENLLIVLDEPFAGVTDDFAPFIVERLNEMREKHNVLLVTNDHVKTLKNMADNTITVSAIDRSKVQINGKEGIDRKMTLLAVSIGDGYKYNRSNKDLEFFRNVEFSKKSGILEVAAYVTFAFAMFVLTFWNSKPGSEALVLIAAGEIAFFTANPYFLQLVDWRIHMAEEAEALMHSSMAMNRLLKTILTLFLLLVITIIQFGCQEAVFGVMTRAEFTRTEFFFGILFNTVFELIALICLGLYTEMPNQSVHILGQVPFLLSMFFSTSYSPGAGNKGAKELRYLFSTFYLWCMLPEMGMEGCPAENNTLLYLILSSLIVPILFLLWKLVQASYANLRQKKAQESLLESMRSVEFAELQLELFGEKVLHRLKGLVSTREFEELVSSYNMRRDIEESRVSQPQSRRLSLLPWQRSTRHLGETRTRHSIG